MDPLTVRQQIFLFGNIFQNLNIKTNEFHDKKLSEVIMETEQKRVYL
jgi:hypothetical protein